MTRFSSVGLEGSIFDGKFQVLRPIGEGGMGNVYEVVDQGGRHLALKIMRDELTGSEAGHEERFSREATALFSLQHRNILKVYHIGVVEQRPYLVMELLHGRSLDQRIEEESLSQAQAESLALQIAEGLAYAHESGILHRDLKPENVFVSEEADGSLRACLLDFGLVKFTDDERWGQSQKLTLQGAVFGTPAYMAPEQCAGAPADARSDVYAAGVMIYELFSGTWPFMEESRLKMFQAHLAKPPPRLSEATEWKFDPALDEILLKALSKKPHERFQDGRELANALGAVLHAAPAPPLKAPSPPSTSILWIAVAALVFVIAVVLAAFFVLGG